MAEMSTQVQAQFKPKLPRWRISSPPWLMRPEHRNLHPLKTGIRINGVMYNAGMSVRCQRKAGKPVVTRVGFNQSVRPDGGSGDTNIHRFAVVNGQVFISDAFIRDSVPMQNW